MDGCSGEEQMPYQPSGLIRNRKGVLFYPFKRITTAFYPFILLMLNIKNLCAGFSRRSLSRFVCLVAESPTYSGQQKWQPAIQGFGFAACGKVCKCFWHPFHPFSYYCCCHLHHYVLLFACRILSTPKARAVLVNGAVRKGERLIPPPALETLIRVTFPPSSARVKVDVQLALVFLHMDVSQL